MTNIPDNAKDPFEGLGSWPNMVAVVPVPKPDVETWYFTFGSNHITAKGHNCHSLGNSFVAIQGTWEQAREAMFSLRGNKWSFQYPWEDFEYQPVKYNLTEIAEEMVWLPAEERV